MDWQFFCVRAQRLAAQRLRCMGLGHLDPRDIVQETLVRCVRDWDNPPDTAYLFTAMYNHIVDLAREHRKITELHRSARELMLNHLKRML